MMSFIMELERKGKGEMEKGRNQLGSSILNG